MSTEINIVEEAIDSLKSLGIDILLDTIWLESDLSIKINGEKFAINVKKNAQNLNYGLLATSFHIWTNPNRLVITDRLNKKTAEELRLNGFNYLDTAGNAFIKSDKLLIYIEGRKAKVLNNKGQARTFQEAGLKLLLLLITNPETINYSYRDLAEKTGIALGSVSNIFKELENNHFLLKINNKKVLKKQDEIIERWVVAYKEILKPRSFRKKMRALDKVFNINDILNAKDLKLFVGGEPGGQILTNYLKPQDYIIYTNEETSKIAKELKLVPDESGNIEIYNKFWLDSIVLKNKDAAPPLVVYADLLSTGNNRNIETAKLILENGL